MNKLTVYGLPLNPQPLLEELRGSSFCVSYATRQKLGKQLDQAIELVGEDQLLLVDNGAFSAWKKGVNTMIDESYLEGFADWANDILDRCPQAVAVLPDVIDGTEEDNSQLVRETMTMLDPERSMPVWHMHESVDYFLWLCESFGYVGIGSSGEYCKIGTPNWHARIDQVFAALDDWEEKSEGSLVRPRIHMMQAQKTAHLHPFDSSDSTNVAMNHKRAAKSGSSVAQTAKRIDDRIQASAGPAADHQVKRPLLDHLEAHDAKLRRMAQEIGLVAIEPVENLDGLDIPEFLRRAA